MYVVYCFFRGGAIGGLLLAAMCAEDLPKCQVALLVSIACAGIALAWRPSFADKIKLIDIGRITSEEPQ